MEDCVDRVGNAAFVTKIDLLKGYWQVPLTERAKEISAFVTPDRFLNYTVMAFGLRNAPATFQSSCLLLMQVTQVRELYFSNEIRLVLSIPFATFHGNLINTSDVTLPLRKRHSLLSLLFNILMFMWVLFRIR
ncbi:hypothetical protein QQF64_009054 [Cirrhinus molitorella]|uniref:ribonuclease H n=1 Tax=Cirrhinus molitorella TaxID=172907 RepID=A0ABR3M7X8_9TELE